MRKNEEVRAPFTMIDHNDRPREAAVRRVSSFGVDRKLL
jgi:hypothetical protein